MVDPTIGLAMSGRLVVRVILVAGVVAAAWPVPSAVTVAADADGITRSVATWALMNVVLGAVLIWQRPGLRYPWLMFCFGLVMVALEIASLRKDDPGSLYFLGLTLPALLAQLFPTGRPVAGRWGWLTYGGPLGLVVALVINATPAVGITVVFIALWLVGLLATFPLVALRFHRSSGVERAQLKWFMFAVAAAFVVWLASSALAAVYSDAHRWGPAAVVSLPVIGIAISLLRYHLYDIDRVISRTTSYVVVTGLLLASYAAVAATISSIVGSSSSLAVAAATLAAAALARPVLRRVQNVVDQRFNRSRYNAIHTVDAFGSRLRNQVDPHHVSEDLAAIVHTTLQPDQVTVWIRQPS